MKLSLIKISALLLIVFLMLICLPDLGYSFQAPPELPTKPLQAPIDGGLALLAAAGGGYAIKKLRDRKNDTTAL